VYFEINKKIEMNKTLFASLVITASMLFNLNCSEKEKLEKKEKTKNTSLTKSDNVSVDSAQNINSAEAQPLEKQILVFVGRNNYSASLEINVYKMDTSGALGIVCSSPKTGNPSFLTIHQNKKWFYAVNESSSGKISAFGFDSVQNTISAANSVSSGGSGPCHLSIDNSGQYVLAANYNNGSIAVLPIKPDGSLGTATSTIQQSGTGPNSGRQSGPHAHMILQARNNFVYCCDLGADKIFIYSLNTSTGVISTMGDNTSTNAGAGPRHIVFHPNNSWAYVVCELTGTIEAFNVNNSTGSLSRFQTITTLAQVATGDAGSAEIDITPDGKYLYASNRANNNNIAMYSINQATGELTLLGHQSTIGKTPRSFAIDPLGNFLLVANQDGNNIVTFKIDPLTGLLSDTGMKTTVSYPVCVKFVEVYRVKTGTGIKTISN
jgi:6-phosphogluconolactonase